MAVEVELQVAIDPDDDAMAKLEQLQKDAEKAVERQLDRVATRVSKSAERKEDREELQRLEGALLTMTTKAAELRNRLRKSVPMSPGKLTLDDCNGMD